MTESKPSKSQRKRQQTELQVIGEQLLDLQEEQLASLQLDERLIKALDEARRMKSHEARRRQKQYIGRLMRDVDPEPIKALFARLTTDDRRKKHIFATAERWRDRLLKEGHEALRALTSETGQADSELAELLTQYANAGSDRSETTIRRKIFRRVHEKLAARSGDG